MHRDKAKNLGPLDIDATQACRFRVATCGIDGTTNRRIGHHIVNQKITQNQDDGWVRNSIYFIYTENSYNPTRDVDATSPQNIEPYWILIGNGKTTTYNSSNAIKHTQGYQGNNERLHLCSVTKISMHNSNNYCESNRDNNANNTSLGNAHASRYKITTGARDDHTAQSHLGADRKINHACHDYHGHTEGDHTFHRVRSQNIHPIGPGHEPMY